MESQPFSFSRVIHQMMELSLSDLRNQRKEFYCHLIRLVGLQENTVEEEIRTLAKLCALKKLSELNEDEREKFIELVYFFSATHLEPSSLITSLDSDLTIQEITTGKQFGCSYNNREAVPHKQILIRWRKDRFNMGLYSIINGSTEALLVSISTNGDIVVTSDRQAQVQEVDDILNSFMDFHHFAQQHPTTKE
ncbi:hypothetical protein KC726_00915 [Candidatus Woesebacteria bacterium]|nr:hypothetical protein [Candidatus Woesebacteria bacterium]